MSDSPKVFRPFARRISIWVLVRNLSSGSSTRPYLPKIRITATCQKNFLSHHHPPTSTYPHQSCNDMSFRQSLSGFRKKVKEKLSKVGDKKNERPAGVGSEGSNPSNLSLQSNKSDWIHTASSAAKLFIRTVERTSDAFPPLKAVAAGLCAILDNCEVRSTFKLVRSIRDAYSSPSKRWSTSRR